MSNFKKGNLIVIIGVKSDLEGSSKHSQTLASIVEVGKYDLFVMTDQSSYRRSMSKVSKMLCEKVELPKRVTTKDCHQPRVGDLVISVIHNYTSDKVESKSGILKEIINLTWKSKNAKLLIGTKYEEVPYDSLIVLEE